MDYSSAWINKCHQSEERHLLCAPCGPATHPSCFNELTQLGFIERLLHGASASTTCQLRREASVCGSDCTKAERNAHSATRTGASKVGCFYFKREILCTGSIFSLDLRDEGIVIRHHSRSGSDPV